MLIASPHICIDRTVAIDRFDAGHIHRARTIESRIGGGGANAIRILHRLSSNAELLTIVPRADEEEVTEALRDTPVVWVKSGGKVRVATILREEEGRISILNEPGPTVDAREWESFVRAVLERVRSKSLLLCSGSLPPGAPVSGYAHLAKHARHGGARCVIDAAGAALEAALDAGEGIVVPNVSEAESVLDGPRREPVHANDTAARACDAANRLLRHGAATAIVTAGAAGAAYAELGPHGRRGWVSTPEVTIRNPVGAGDAFAAGLGMRLEAGATLDAAVEFGVAVAAAHVEAPRGELDPTRVDQLAASVGPNREQLREDLVDAAVA